MAHLLIENFVKQPIVVGTVVGDALRGVIAPTGKGLQLLAQRPTAGEAALENRVLVRVVNVVRQCDRATSGRRMPRVCGEGSEQLLSPVVCHSLP